MSDILVVYNSYNGSTKRYAQWLAQATDADIYNVKDLGKDSVISYSKIVYLGAVRMGMIKKYKKFKAKYLSGVIADTDTVIVCGVGMYDPTDEYLTNLIQRSGIGEKERLIFLKGSINVKATKGKLDRAMLKMMIKALSAKDDLTKDEKGMLDTFQNPVDNTKPEYLERVVELLGCDKGRLKDIEYESMYK